MDDLRDTVLICLPFSGAGASFFHGWQARPPTGIRVMPVQLPGREDRFIEPPLTDVVRAVDDVQSRLDLPGGARVALFGHSLGAVLAYELAHRLTGHTQVAGLFVSGSPSPWRGRGERATGLPDAEFVTRVEAFAGYSHPALADEEVRELVLPVLRADVEMHENYCPPPRPPLTVPVTVFRGCHDELVSAQDSAGWREATSGPFETVEFDGGHMYFLSGDGAGLAMPDDAVLSLIGARLDLARAQ